MTIGGIGNVSAYQFPDIDSLRLRRAEHVPQTPQAKIEQVKRTVEDLRLKVPVSDLVPDSAADTMPPKLVAKGPLLYDVTGRLTQGYEPLVDIFK
jgi:hypothetical protein